MRISLSGDVIAKAVAASTRALGTFDARRVYDLSRVHLIKVGCPGELAASRENKVNLPIVVERNRREFGLVRSIGYSPAVIVVAGAYRRDQMLARGILNCWGWVERGAITIQADDAISSGELAEKLTNLLQVKFYGNNKPIFGQPWPYITQVYPFENYMIYEFAGQKYRQAYALDAVDRDVKLSGDSVKVNEQFVDAADGTCGLTRTQSGMRQVNNPLPLDGNQVASRPNPDADLIRMIIRSVGNVDAVVSKMLSAIKFGLYKPLKPDFAPVNLSDAGKLLGPLVEAGISPADFVCYVDVHAHDFSTKRRKKLAKTGAAMKDGSFPIENVKDVHNAVSLFHHSPDQATKRHIIKRAKAVGAAHLLPSKWGVKVDIKSFGQFHSKHKHDTGNPKKVTFRV